MSATKRIALILFVVAWGANHFVPLLIVYRARMHLTDVDLATLFGVYAVGLVPGLLLGGPLSDRFGRKAVVAPSALLALVGSAVLAYGARAGTAALLAGRLIVGIGSGATFTAGTAWMQDATLDAREGVGSRRAAVALSAGFGGGPLVASVVAQFFPEPLVLPYVLQIAVLAFAFAGLLTLPVTDRATMPPSVATRRAFVPPGFWAENLPVAPWVFAFPAVAFAVLPAMVRDRVGAFAVLYAGLVTAATLAAGVLIQRPLASRTARGAGAFGLAVGAAGLVLAAAATWAHSAWVVLVAAALLGVGYGGTLIAGLRVSALAEPADRGRVTGVFYVLAYLGFAAPLALAAASRRIGAAPSLLVAALGAWSAAVWAVRPRAAS